MTVCVTKLWIGEKLYFVEDDVKSIEEPRRRGSSEE